MAGSMALINLAKDAAQGNIHNFGDAFGSLGKGALQGLAGAAGGVVGGKLASFAAGKLGGLATSLGGRMLTGALEGAGEDVVDQLMTTGTVDLGSVGMSALIGGATGGRAHAGGHTSDLRRATDAVTPSPRRQLSGDSGTQSPGRDTSDSGSPSSNTEVTNCHSNCNIGDLSGDDLHALAVARSSKPGAKSQGPTAAGRSIDKHASPKRGPEQHARYDFGRTTVEERDWIGQTYIEEMLTDSNSRRKLNIGSSGDSSLEIHMPNGIGGLWAMEGGRSRFVGFRVVDPF
jgi:hypothetical protein